MLRDWTDSEAVNGLTAEAERFFTRLIMKVDDYGRYSANPSLLKSMLFPLSDKIRQTDCTHWMAACQKAGLILLYEVASKPYVQIVNFNQRMRQMQSKYPPPEDGHSIVGQMTDNCQTDDGLKRRGREEKGKEGDAACAAPHSPSDEDFTKLLSWMQSNTPRVLQMKEPLTEEQFQKLKARFSKVQISDMLKAMHNYELLLKKSRSTYLTFLTWAKRDNLIQGPKAIRSPEKHLPDAQEVLAQYD